MQTNTMSRRHLLQTMASLAGLALLASGCGRAAAGAAPAGDAIQLAIACDGDMLAFAPPTLTAPAAASIELTFSNRSAYHQHNWVLVNGGDEAASAVDEAALAAGVTLDFLPRDHSQIIVHTPLLQMGKSATITFRAPAKAGNYHYLCTFPGHYLAGMKGILTVV